MSASLLLSLLLFSWAVLFAAFTLAARGYRAVTREEVAAYVTTEPTGSKTFIAHFEFPDGREDSFALAGDALYVDAHIIKWKTAANLLGLHTLYELDRVAGRYSRLEDEQRGVRTVHSLSEDKPVDLFDLRRRYALLGPLMDAEYGSATFVPADRRSGFELRVSTTGLMIRENSSEKIQGRALP
jgi:hypothetical protein